MTLNERLDVNDPKTWPIGAPIMYDGLVSSMLQPSRRHVAVGIVIGNYNGRLEVMWPQHCAQKLSNYPIVSLNRDVISRPW